MFTQLIKNVFSKAVLFGAIFALVGFELIVMKPSTAFATTESRDWVFPTDQTKSSRPFEPPAQNWLAGHRGVDFSVVVGQEVYAAGAGTVVFAQELANKGVIVINHGLVRTTYEPVSSIVEVGDQVLAGQVIGNIDVGISHCSTQEKVWCLHWGAIRAGKYLNPLYLIYPKVRLLPLKNRS